MAWLEQGPGLAHQQTIHGRPEGLHYDDDHGRPEGLHYDHDPRQA